MGTWILIISLISNYEYANSQIAIEFSSKEACVEAGDRYKKLFVKDDFRVRTLCAYKGDKK